MSQYDDVDVDQLLRVLTNNFNILANEVQLLGDRKTVLEHKLRFAHEQYQYLADKYAPADVEISSTLAKLQLPPELQLSSPEPANFVPLPSRRPAGTKQQTAEAIRDGRRASQKIAYLKGWNTSSIGGRTGSISGFTSSNMRTSRRGTSATTLLEQDFTIPGKKSQLLCPFAPKPDTMVPLAAASPSGQLANAESKLNGHKDTTPNHSEDPICAAMYAEAVHSPEQSIAGSAAKCPIRYLDQHSPEEVAQYFESHKHEIPRSHEVCVKRYQRNEGDIRKLDAKYGNLVSMLQGLGQKHQPMLPVSERQDSYEIDRKSNERVEDWAQAVSGDGRDVSDAAETPKDDEDREGRFDRPLKEVRVGESPSRPWGISVPFVENPAPPYDDFELPATPAPVTIAPTPVRVERPAGKCPFGHGQRKEIENPSIKPQPVVRPSSEPGDQTAQAQPVPPTFLQQNDVAKLADSGGPQMVFTGPVFIGYPIDQAMALMQQWQAGAASAGKASAGK